jgi:hypothetical protein
MKHVTIKPRDYKANHKAAIEREDVPSDVSAPTVKRYERVMLHCSYRHCPDPVFQATFDEVQRIIPCPSCNHEVFVPEGYRGIP